MRRFRFDWYAFVKQNVSPMKTATVREVRQNFGQLLSWIDSGEEVTITMRRKIVARIVPPRPKKSPKPDWKAFVARQKKALAGKKIPGKSLIEEEREGYRW
jgi:antitoxin (DNA-binding transcriptional repressor) of toxin-antitoxin stability system